MFIFLLILFVCILLLPSRARADEAPAAHQRRSLQSLHDAFSSAANSQYAYSIAHRLATDLHLHNNATYGGRQAGSDAEHAAADYLADEMRRIGLSDVEKAAAKCDKWQFNGASFTVNGKALTSYLADVDDMGDFVGDTEVVIDGEFKESFFRAAPYFDLNIDGITLPEGM